MVTIGVVIGFIVVAIAGCKLVLWVRWMVQRIEDLERHAEQSSRWFVRGIR